MRWTKKETKRGFNSYYYETEYEDIKLSIYQPFNDDLWTTRLMMDDNVVYKTDFHLRENNLEKAKEMAFNIMGAYTRNWTNGIQNKLAEMKMLQAVS